MKPILQLDNQLINKIAAGEVVERPLSVVKELTENAIDAGASGVTVELRDGGLAAIRVTDNGTGIASEQLPLAFARHATSKIASFDDLFNVRTLGFRGEALCSIAAVAQVEILTKTADAVMGTRMEIHGGQIVAHQPVGCTNGTTLIVSNLFFNTPARRKFLKKPATEAGYVSDCMNRLALSHPGLSFRYIHNGQSILQTNGSDDLKTTILQVYGRQIASKLLAVQADCGDYQLSGYIGKPEIARGNRQYGTFFVNGRYIQSKLLQQAVEAAMKTMLPSGKFPVYVLRLTLPADRVDVNVHPNKMDVRFAEEEELAGFIREAVFGALTDHSLIPEVSLSPRRVAPTEDDSPYEEQSLTAQALPAPAAATPAPPRNEAPVGASAPPALVLHEPPKPTKTPFFRDYYIHGLLFGTYWLLTQGDSLYLIDQHAAHERVLYDEITQQVEKTAIPSQPLLEAVALRLTPRETQLLCDHHALFERFGFVIGGHPPKLTGVPFMLRGPLSVALLTDALDALEDSTPVLKENAVAMMACKAAVKANDHLSEPEARALILKLLLLDNPYTCPHGRPTMIEITKKEIERKFNRV